jgi:HEAT repeat protein
MKNSFQPATSTFEINHLRFLIFKFAVLLVLLTASAFLTPFVSHAQRLYQSTRVSNVNVQTSSNETLVSIVADGSLNRAQTWQDTEGFHVVLPDTYTAESLKTARGVRIRRLGSSLEVLLQTRVGARVSVQPGEQQLTLVVDGRLEPKPGDFEARAENNTLDEKQLFQDPSYDNRVRQEPPQELSSTVDDLSANTASASTSTTVSQNGPTAKPAQIDSNQIVPQQDGSKAPYAPPSEIKVESQDDGGLLASVFSGTSVLIVIGLGLFGLIATRKLRSREAAGSKLQVVVDEEPLEEERARKSQDDPAPNTSMVKSNGSNRASAVARVPVAGPTTLYGAYRIDQEVGKLILGQPHRIDVLASRAIDDRRAVETSLIRGVNASELDETARRRAREALEEYGFVARQCAALLLAPDAFERSTAARSLGEIKSPAALPFLLESLYDSESIVRNQAVVSIGELKLPSAIGALLDIARTHPDVPSALLNRTLSACSVEGLDFFDAELSEPSLLGSNEVGNVIDEITHLEPSSTVEDLPESSDDETFAQTLEAIGSDDADKRAEAIKALGQYRVQSAVNALTHLARFELEPNVRSLAISSLGLIDHESVFPAILIGMADESREVRASAARSLNRLSFDRCEAYVRVIETNDEETIQKVAKACTQAGIVSQNLDRLSSSDHRQAYEAFSIICLLAKAKMNDPVLDAISGHPNVDVRLKAVHLLACAGEPETFEQLRQLAVKDGMREEVKTALLEAMYKIDQSKPKEEEVVSDFAFISADPDETEDPVGMATERELESGTVNDSQFESHHESEVRSNPNEFEF